MSFTIEQPLPSNSSIKFETCYRYISGKRLYFLDNIIDILHQLYAIANDLYNSEIHRIKFISVNGYVRRIYSVITSIIIAYV